MNSNLYPVNNSGPGRSGIAKVLNPEWIRIFSVYNFFSGINFLKIFSVLLAVMLLDVNFSYGQSPCPDNNCTSGDMTITKVELVDANTLGVLPNICQPGQQTVQVKLKVTFDATAQTRYGFLVIGNVKINGQFLTKIWQCYPENFTGTNSRILDQVIDWPCGSTISLTDVFTAWDQQAPATTICSYLGSDGSLSNCASINPKCRYYGDQSFTVAAPLVANFTYDGSCGANDLYAPITFTSTSTNGNTPYQFSWEIRDAGSNTLLATSTNNPYTYTPQSANNLSVKLTVTDASSSQQTDTETKTVSVISCCAPSTINAHPQNQVKCQGSSASFTVGYTGGNPAPSIQWQVSTNSGGSWNNISNNATYSGTTTATLTVSNVSTSMNGYLYRAVLTNGACTSVQSNSASLSVDPTSVGGSVASPQTICYGTQPANALTLSGHTGAVVKWQRSTSSNFTSGVSDIANTTTTLSAATIGNLTQNTWFRAEVKSGECVSVYSSSVLITVNPLSVGGSVASPQTICYNNQPNSSLTLSGYTGSIVKWQKSTTSNFLSGVTDIAVTSATLTPANMGALTQDTWFRAVVKSGECAEENSSAVKITVDPATVGGTLASDQTICSGNQPSSSITLSGNVGSVVKWQKSTTSNFSGGSVTDIAITTTTLSPASIGTLTQDVWIRAVVKSGVCNEANSGVVKITVQQPIGNNTIAASQTICSGYTPAGLTGSTPTGGDGNYTYQWQLKTTGSFSNISGATGKDYQPGALLETTQFRRIVTAGTACSNHTSPAMTISISPESQIFAISSTNYCNSAPNTGTVTIAGSYPGVSYQLKKQSGNVIEDIQNPKVGNGSSLTWTGLGEGIYFVYGTGIAPTFCTSQTAITRIFEFDCSVFYTLTQGYYGGKNGKSCPGTNPVTTILNLLGTTDMVIGTANSITIPANLDGAKKLNQSMPGGSTARALPVGNCTITAGCFTYPTYLTTQGRINNVLLSQTITLSLNTRWNGGELLLFPIRNGYLTTQKMTGCGPDADLIEVCESGTVSSILMNQNVVNYLGANGTVGDLLQLANDVLGGTKTPGVNGVPSYADINAAVDAINKSFDEGRRFLDYFAEYQTCEMLFPSPALPEPILLTASEDFNSGAATNTIENNLSITAYPNPFFDNVTFMIKTSKGGQGSLEVFSITGQKVKTIFQGYLPAGTQRFSMYLPTLQRSSLIYIFRMDGERKTGKLIYLKHH